MPPEDFFLLTNANRKLRSYLFTAFSVKSGEFPLIPQYKFGLRKSNQISFRLVKD